MTVFRAALGLCAIGLLSACSDRPPRPDDPAGRGNAARTTNVDPPAKSSTEPTAGASKIGRSSQFTRLSEADCKLVETIAETGDWTRSCPDVAGYAIEWSSGDLREDLALSTAGRKRPLQIPTLVANGAFDRIGNTAEWRGPDGSAPDVLVLRVHVAGPDGRDDGGRLAVARLGRLPCLVAIVPPGPGQNDRARKIANGPLPGCLGQ